MSRPIIFAHLIETTPDLLQPFELSTKIESSSEIPNLSQISPPMRDTSAGLSLMVTSTLSHKFPSILTLEFSPEERKLYEPEWS
jgi:hypothetical protein